MIDTEAIRARVDLLDLVGVQLRKISGSEYAGPCPRCGGDDRFHVTAGWFFCRRCHEKRGDAIEYVQWRDGLAFADACALLGGSHEDALARPMQRRTAREPAPPPTAAWQATAARFVAYAQKRLWQAPEAVAYLVDRGLSEATIKAAKLGYNPRTRFDRNLARWGKDEGKAVWLPAGWTIPCWQAGQLRYVKVRRPGSDIRAAQVWNDTHPKQRRADDKYVCLYGSKRAGLLYGLDDVPASRDLIICEGEFDAMLLRQEIGNLAAVVATGAAGALPGTEALRALVRFRRLWIALDTDAAGQAGADKWCARYARARRLVLPEHDITDMWLAGHDLAGWITANS